MFGLSTELMTNGKLAVKGFDFFTVRISRAPTKSSGLCEFES